MVTVRGAEFSYRSGWRLGPIDLSLRTGVTALIGPNGSGKSTLIRLLAGIALPKSGHIEFEGKPLSTGSQVSNYRRYVGYLPQDPRWGASWRVCDYVDFVAQGYGISRADCAAARETALTAAGASDFTSRKLGSLSGGERQRVHLATAIIHDPQILILDEPTVGLDPAERVRIRNFLRDQATKRSVLLSTHLMDDVAMSADVIHIMLGGNLLWHGDVAALESVAGVVPGGLSAAEAGYLAVVEK